MASFVRAAHFFRSAPFPGGQNPAKVSVRWMPQRTGGSGTEFEACVGSNVVSDIADMVI
jgi:hypothetical protein